MKLLCKTQLSIFQGFHPSINQPSLFNMVIAEGFYDPFSLQYSSFSCPGFCHALAHYHCNVYENCCLAEIEQTFVDMLTNISGSGSGSNYYEDNKNYWNSILNLVNSDFCSARFC